MRKASRSEDGPVTGVIGSGEGNAMSELERNLNRILQEHQHESGLHMIGGQRRLLDRLVEFFEERKDPAEKDKDRSQQN
jgi:hypothetical protein